MQAPRLIGALLTHGARGANISGPKEPDASKGDVLLFCETFDDDTQDTVEPALLTHFEQQALQCIRNGHAFAESGHRVDHT